MMTSISTRRAVFCLAPLVALASRIEDVHSGADASRRFPVELLSGVVDASGELPFPIESLSGVVKRESKPELLGVGAYGSVWLVQDASSGSQEIMKLFFPPGRRDCFLTRRDLRRSRNRKAVAQVRKECELAKKLHAEVRGVGAQRLLRCLGHNLDRGDDGQQSTPLYLLLSYNGQGTLDDYLGLAKTHGALTLDWLKSVFKQVLQGLDALHSLEHPAIHHDLKTNNVIVWTHEGKEGQQYFTARLIDYGGMVDTERDGPCLSTAATESTSPPELDAWRRLHRRTCLFLNYDPDYPTKFDVYGLGAIFVESFTGMKDEDLVHEVDKAYCDKVRAACRRRPSQAGRGSVRAMGTGGVFKATQQSCRTELRFCKKKGWKQRDSIRVLQSPFLLHFLTSREYRAKIPFHFQGVLSRIAADPSGLGFVKLIQNCYSFEPKDRPSAKDLLRHAWLKDVQTPTAPVEAYRGAP